MKTSKIKVHLCVTRHSNNMDSQSELVTWSCIMLLVTFDFALLYKLMYQLHTTNVEQHARAKLLGRIDNQNSTLGLRIWIDRKSQYVSAP